MKPTQRIQTDHAERLPLSAAEPSRAVSLLPQAADIAIGLTRRWLMSQQDPEGFWCGELEGDSILQSEYILLLAWLGRENTPVAQMAARRLLEQQEPHGGWSLYPGGKLDISASVKAYFALKLTGSDPKDEPLRRAKSAIMSNGGADRVNSFTRFYLALLGQISYDHCPAVPPEAILLPSWFPINIYRVSAWSRTILVPLSILWAHRPVRELADNLGIKELFVAPPERWPELKCVGTENSRWWFSWEAIFRRLDKTLKLLERYRIRPFRRRALEKAKTWMINRFVASDGLGAIFPPIIWSIVALKSLGYRDDSLEVRYCHEQLKGLFIEDQGSLRLQPCKSPVWDTAITLRSLARAGVKSSHSSIRRAISWLLSKEVTRRGDWSETVDTDPGGWFFEYHNDFYPDVDDTAMVLMALGDQFADSRLDDPQAPSGVSFIASDRANDVKSARDQVVALERAAEACDRGRRWLLAMQNHDGGWGAFDKDNDCAFLCHVPFADHNAMIDPSTPDITGRVLESLGILGARVDVPVVDRAVRFMRKHQESDGSWYGRWGVNHIYGTWQSLVGLRAVGVSADDDMMKAGTQWLLNCQQPSGGWGESPDSYDDSSLRGKGIETASQTAWAVLGLLESGLENHEAVDRGISWLVNQQNADGTWGETEFTGTGFPRVFYLRYHMYPICFPLWAIARWQELGNKATKLDR